MTEKLTRRPSAVSDQTAKDQALVASPFTRDTPFSAQFFDKSPAAAASRAIYFKTLGGGVAALSILIFAVCSIYWGSLWKSPGHPLPGWIVDFDGGFIGQGVTEALSGIDPGVNGIAWEVVPATQFPGGIAQLEAALVQEETWVAVAISPGATSTLMGAISTADASYNGSFAVTFMGVEARNENSFRILRSIAGAQLEAISQQFALQGAQNLSSAPNLAALLSTAPQIVTRPVSYTVYNARPFDIPVATAITLVGLIYLLILSFFVVAISAGAREASGIEQRLTLSSLLRVRLVSSCGSYFFISLFYALLSLAFKVSFDRRFGRAGFVVFWMLNWLGMTACGLALEAMITILTIRFIPFFLLPWIITNISVSIFPIPVLPGIFGYGYAAPFYNISRAVRTIVFGTKNTVGLNFGILIAWIALSCLTMSLFQWLMRRKAIAESK
ncbi:hypothetical protein C8J57DRAFT_1177506 [Mycena rebaudengoi]|nr:hypothetical protein C8J57DRAFT_1177506 [Mycena rebaudengoi]